MKTHHFVQLMNSVTTDVISFVNSLLRRRGS